MLERFCGGSIRQHIVKSNQQITFTHFVRHSLTYGTGSKFTPSGHFITRLKDARTAQLGIHTFKDLEVIFRKGTVVHAGDGLIAIVHKGMAILVNPNTNKLVTFRPW